MFRTRSFHLQGDSRIYIYGTVRFTYCESGSSIGIATELRAGWSGDRISQIHMIPKEVAAVHRSYGTIWTQNIVTIDNINHNHSYCLMMYLAVCAVVPNL